MADVRDEATTLDAIAAIGSWQPILASQRDPERFEGLRVSGDFFDLLGVVPEAGRLFVMDDDQPDADLTPLSSPIWRTLCRWSESL